MSSDPASQNSTPAPAPGNSAPGSPARDNSARDNTAAQKQPAAAAAVRKSSLINWSRVGQATGTIILGALMIMLLQPGTGRRVAPRASVHCADHLRQIGKALANYVQDHRCYPPQYVADPQGKPLLSWRVLILPYLGEQILYAKFRRNEPWDSPHNLALLPLMPKAFRCPLQDTLPPGHTTYLAATGPGCVFNGKVSTTDELVDHLNTTIIAGEVNQRHAAWSEPVDLPIFDHLRPGDENGFSSRHAEGAHFLFADGHVSFLTGSFPTEIIRQMATHAGGEEIPAPEDWHLFSQ